MEKYIELAVAYLRRNAEGSFEHQDSDFYDTRRLNIRTTPGGNVIPDFGALHDMAADFDRLCHTAAANGIRGVSLHVGRAPDILGDVPEIPFGEVLVRTEMKWDDWRPDYDGRASLRAWASEETWQAYQSRYKHGAVDVMAFLIDDIYRKTSKPCKLGVIGTDYASFDWIPSDFYPDEDDCASMADALEAGVPYEDVFANYNPIR